MLNSIKTTARAACAAALLAAASQAAISISTSVAYMQNFDGIGTTTTAELPTDFRVDKLTSVRTLGTFSAAVSNTGNLGGANLSASAANGIYNFGAGTTTTGSDRAVGFLSSGTGTQSGNLYAQLVNNTGAPLTGLRLSYAVEKYRLGLNPAGFSIQLYYSTDGTNWNPAGASFLTSFPQDGGTVNSGFATAPGATVTVSNQNLNVAILDNSSLYLAWNYSVTNGTTTTNAQALAIDDISILGLSSSSTNPSGTGAANPMKVQAGSSALLTVSVTPGTTPVSTGIAVLADLTGIGGSAAQVFLDDGSNGDIAAGDNVFSFLAPVSVATVAGSKMLPVSITDAQERSGSVSISLTVTPFATPPTGVSLANPSSLMAGAPALLTVSVTPGANPASTGITVSANLTAIGGSSPQPFFDDGTHGDVTPSDAVFSFSAPVDAGTAPGTKSLPVTVSDAQSRSNSTAISLTVESPPLSPTAKISQAYGGGGNSGSTYKNDFIEIFNQAATPIDVSTWSVQYAASNQSNWQVTPLCAAPPCMIGPGRYFLVWESQGAGGTTSLPTADAMGTITMGAGSAQVALVANTTPLTGVCPTGGAILDFVGYGTTTCSNPMSSALSNTTAAIRKGNGCIDTDNDHNDFLEDGPIPRNSSAPPNSCAIADPAKVSGLGTATPDSVQVTAMTLLTVRVVPAATPQSTNMAVTADLSTLGGSAAQQFFDDGTHGDQAAGDNTFSVLATIAAAVPTGVKYLMSHVTDEQGRGVDVPITLSVESPTCGVEYWNVKTGTDADAATVNLNHAVPTTIADLRAIPIAYPGGDRPTVNFAATRIAPTEFTVYQVHATLTNYKLEDDVDYHIVLQDENGSTIITEIPSPACIMAQSPFLAGVMTARAKADSRLTPNNMFQSANLTVQVKGVGFFDVLHGQTGVAPNGIELHPILDLNFTSRSTTLLTSGLNPSQFGQGVTFTATVSNGGVSTPTGIVTFLEGTSMVGTAVLNASGQAMYTTNSLVVGTHTITASYEGDSNSTPSKSGAIVQTVDKADQTITFPPIPDKTYGDAAFLAIAGGGGSGNHVNFSVSGNCTSSGQDGATIAITGAGSCAVTASQAGNANYIDATPVSRTFNIDRAAVTVTAAGFTGVYDGLPHGTTVTAFGIQGEDLSNLLTVGPNFVNAPGGTASWSFEGNTNYAPATGSVAIVIQKATPAFSNLSTIAVGVLPTTVSGKISLGALIPTGTVAVALNGATQNAAIQEAGAFSTTFTTGALPANPGPIGCSYSGDTNFNAVSASIVLGASQAVSVTPGAGTGSLQTFAFVYTDSAGAADLRQAWIWFTPAFGNSAANSCMLYYEPSSNLLRLINDPGSAWLAGTPGSNGTLQNSQCSVSLNSVTAMSAGNTLTLSVPLAFTVAFAGTKQVWMYALASAGNSGWQQLGSWVAPAAPVAASVTPATGTGAVQTFQFLYSDPAGTADLRQGWVWFTPGFGNTATSSCMFYYDQTSNQLKLLNDAGSAFAFSGTPGANATLQNSQCSISLSTAVVAPAGNNLTLSIPLSFSAAFAGSRQVWMYALGNGGNSGWQQRGNWTVPSAPSVVSVTPNMGSGSAQTFQFLYSDPAGATDLRQEWVWFTPSFGNSAANSCMWYYEQSSNLLRLINDAGTSWLTGTPGEAATLQNSQCRISLSTTTVSPSGNNVTISVPLTFTRGFGGVKQVWMHAAGSVANSGWQQRGSWTVPSAPSVVSVMPNTGSGSAQTFQFLYSDPAGAADLRQEWVWFTPSFGNSAANSCMLYYEQSSNLLRLINDAGTSWLMGTPGEAATLQNSQCRISLSTMTVLPTGNNVTISVPVTFTGAFAGTKQVWMYALGGSGNSGWQQMGSWSP